MTGGRRVPSDVKGFALCVRRTKQGQRIRVLFAHSESAPRSRGRRALRIRNFAAAVTTARGAR